ncbi:hypothetical protein CPB86DRAFT_871738 [Serendipita vermifera]|nr:hypothetical protein CPB86DRAFT_871738 [Serendipita vermifera]
MSGNISHSLSAFPPSTRTVLGTPNGPSSSLPNSSLNTGSSGAGVRSPNNNGEKERYLEGTISTERTPRPGTSLINMHAASSSMASSAKNGLNANEHLGNHEHLYYTAPNDDPDDPISPIGSSNYRSYQLPSHNPSQPSMSAQLRANRAASNYNTTAGDPYSLSGGNIHSLHSKGSNLSTSTFISPPRDRDKNKERDAASSSTSTGTMTPTPSNAPPLTPMLPASQPVSSKPSTPQIGQSDTLNKVASPETPVSSVTIQTPQSTNSALPGPTHPAVVRTKSTAAPSSTSNGQRIRDRRGTSARERERDREGERRPKIRTIPHLPHGQAEPAPPTLMYWSRAPVYGHLPTRSMRAHSVTLVDNTAWLFGGCDERGCARDVWCCDIETFQWSHPPLTGDIPPPCRAHTATLVDGKRIFIFGGGEGPTYYNSLYILDTQARKFTWVPCGQKPGTAPEGSTATNDSSANPQSGAPASSTSTPSSINRPLPSSTGGGNTNATSSPQSGPAASLSSVPTTPNTTPSPVPLARRAHTAVLYKHKLYIFGGGNGVKALNDVWCIDTSVSVEKMRWEQVKTNGPRPGPRGYHTANLVGNHMIVVGGSDGRDCFSDIWVLNLDTLQWALVETEKDYKRLSHSSTQVGSYLFIMGGHDGAKYSSELLLFNLVTLQYEHKVTLGRPPPARGYHVSLLADVRLFVFGGFDGHTVYDDVWILDLAGAAYLPQVTSFALLIDNGQ